MMRAGALLLSAGYMLATVVGGILFFVLGYLLAQSMTRA